MTWTLLVLLSACEARINGAPTGVGAAVVDAPSAIEDAPADAPIDARVLGAWSTPAKIGPAATAAVEDDDTLSSNTLEMIFAIAGAGTSVKDLYYTSRASTASPWTTATKLGFNSAASDETPRLSADDKTLYFASGRNTTDGTLDIFSVTRAAAGSTTWSATVTPLTTVNTTTKTEKWFMPCGTAGDYVMIQSDATGDTNLVEGTLGGPAPTLISQLNSAFTESGTFLTTDCLTIYFASARTTPMKIFTSHRATVTSPWLAPTEVDDFMALGGNQEDPWISSDSRTFAFVSDISGTKDVYISTR